jgi:hypothetical protein
MHHQKNSLGSVVRIGASYWPEILRSAVDINFAAVNIEVA